MLLTSAVVLLVIIVLTVQSVLVDLADHSERNKHLVEAVSKERILGQEDVVAKVEEERKQTKRWSFRNATGHLFECLEPISNKQVEDSTTKAGSENSLTTTTKFTQAALDARIELLRGVCVSHDGGWWTTRWCHAAEVRQSHFEGAREVTSYSLGSFSTGEVRLVQSDVPLDEGDAKSEPLPLFYAETFINGQVCDETGESRRTEVRLYCCPKDKAVSLVSLQETTLCQYTMTLCWASLCEVGLPPLSPNSRDTWSAIRPLTGLCFRYKGESGWIHEICFEKGARAFRQIIAKDLATGEKKNMQNNRVLEIDVKRLGSFTPLKTFDDKGETISTGVPQQTQIEGDGRSVHQVYTNGDVCGESDRYESHVKIACFLTKTSIPEIVSVRWTSKCRTLMLMHSPGLCETGGETGFKRNIKRGEAIEGRDSIEERVLCTLMTEPK